MTEQSIITLNDGNTIPQVGLGVWQTPNDEAAPAVKAALDAGYRHVDTAAVYENEEGVGEGIRRSGLDRKDIFLTTKLWNNDQGYDQTLKDFDASLKRLGTDYVIGPSWPFRRDLEGLRETSGGGEGQVDWRVELLPRAYRADSCRDRRGPRAEPDRVAS